MDVNIREIPFNLDITEDKKSVTFDDVPIKMWERNEIEKSDPLDQVILRNIFVRDVSGRPPCPKRKLGDTSRQCSVCLFGSPCSSDYNVERQDILAHLFEGGTINLKN